MNKIKLNHNTCTVGQILDYYASCDACNLSPSLPFYVENGEIYIQYED